MRWEKSTLSYMENNTKSISRHEETICVSTKRREIPVCSSFCVFFSRSLARSPFTMSYESIYNAYFFLHSTFSPNIKMLWKLV